MLSINQPDASAGARRVEIRLAVRDDVPAMASLGAQMRREAPGYVWLPYDREKVIAQGRPIHRCRPGIQGDAVAFVACDVCQNRIRCLDRYVARERYANARRRSRK